MDVLQQIDIVAGQYYYESRVTFSGSQANLDLVPGIVNMKSDSLYVLELNEAYTALLTHDYQAEDTTLLAMVLMVPADFMTDYGETKEAGEGVTQTYYAVLDAHCRPTCDLQILFPMGKGKSTLGLTGRD